MGSLGEERRLMPFLVRSVNRLLRNVGFRVVREQNQVVGGALDLRATFHDPISAWYLYGGRPFLIDVELHRCRAWGPTGFPCDVDAGNPFVDTLVRQRDYGPVSYDGSLLAEYYRTCIPGNAAEVLGIQPETASSGIKKCTRLGYVFPWEHADPANRSSRRYSVVQNENTRGGITDVAIDEHPHFGPVSRQKGELELNRLVDVFVSIQQNGFDEWHPQAKSVTAGTVLVLENEWRVHIRKGNHRIAALTALGYRSVPIRFEARVPLIVRREDVDYWPHVRDGLFTKKQALDVFDRIFHGTGPRPFIQRTETDNQQ